MDHFPGMFTFHLLVRLFVFSLLVICVLCGLVAWFQELADVVVLNCNGGEKKKIGRKLLTASQVEIQGHHIMFCSLLTFLNLLM